MGLTEEPLVAFEKLKKETSLKWPLNFNKEFRNLKTHLGILETKNLRILETWKLGITEEPAVVALEKLKKETSLKWNYKFWNFETHLRILETKNLLILKIGNKSRTNGQNC